MAYNIIVSGRTTINRKEEEEKITLCEGKFASQDKTNKMKSKQYSNRTKTTKQNVKFVVGQYSTDWGAMVEEANYE